MDMKLVVEYYLLKAGFALSDEDGQGLIEYVLIAALISVAAIASIKLVGPAVATKFTTVSNALT
jgi:Flp pilus assembly pilin Flp